MDARHCGPSPRRFRRPSRSSYIWPLSSSPPTWPLSPAGRASDQDKRLLVAPGQFIIQQQRRETLASPRHTLANRDDEVRAGATQRRDDMRALVARWARAQDAILGEEAGAHVLLAIAALDVGPVQRRLDAWAEERCRAEHAPDRRPSEQLEGDRR